MILMIGILHLKDAMKEMMFENHAEETVGRIPNLIRDASYIPETRSINDLFKRMQAKKLHMAIVVDEYGQTSGIVTMEDILEEIVNLTKHGCQEFVITGIHVTSYGKDCRKYFR